MHHVDQKALQDWAAAFHPVPQQTYVVHGKAHAAQTFAQALTTQSGFKATIPALGERFAL